MFHKKLIKTKSKPGGTWGGGVGGRLQPTFMLRNIFIFYYLIYTYIPRKEKKGEEMLSWKYFLAM